jgi:hypothetical protein
MAKVYITPVSGNAAMVAGLSIPAAGGSFDLNESQAEHFKYDNNFKVSDKKPAPAAATEAELKAAKDALEVTEKSAAEAAKAADIAAKAAAAAQATGKR